mgnify:CR=1 FL=1
MVVYSEGEKKEEKTVEEVLNQILNRLDRLEARMDHQVSKTNTENVSNDDFGLRILQDLAELRRRNDAIIANRKDPLVRALEKELVRPLIYKGD